MSVVLISYTQLGAGGGVPRFNRDLIYALPDGKHYSWFDMLRELRRPDVDIPEWDKARALNGWLKATKRITNDDIIIADGFWGIGLEDHPKFISVAHGNWSHTTADDVALGIPPEFPLHAAVQLEFRKKVVGNGGRIVAVSDFISHQCKVQWGFDFPVINNGIDLSRFVPANDRKDRKRPVIIHGTTTGNKGFDHIDMLKQHVDADVLLLDDAASFFGLSKYQALAQADLVVHPSAHEGNSYFLLEALSSGIPIVSYDVGLMFYARNSQNELGLAFPSPGHIVDRRLRSKECTLDATRFALNVYTHGEMGWRPRQFAEMFSVEKFRQNWLDYLDKEFGYDPLSC